MRFSRFFGAITRHYAGAPGKQEESVALPATRPGSHRVNGPTGLTSRHAEIAATMADILCNSRLER